MNVSAGNTLEAAKLFASLVTPVLVLILGIVINNSVKAAERSMSLRSELYKTIGGELNDIYSYLSFVGGWKELTPAEVIARKRAVDKAMYTYKPFSLKSSSKRTLSSCMKHSSCTTRPERTPGFVVTSLRTTAIGESIAQRPGRRHGRTASRTSETVLHNVKPTNDS